MTEHRHLVTYHQHLSALISSTISAHSPHCLLIRSTVHYPELTRPSVHLPVFTYFSALLRSSCDTPSKTPLVPGSRSPSFLQETFPSVVSEDPLNCSIHQDTHLPFAPHDLLPFHLSINLCIITYPLSPACVL